MMETQVAVEHALRLYEKSHGLAPQDPRPLRRIADIHIRFNQREKAHQTLWSLYELESQAGTPEHTLPLLREILDLTPHHTKALSALANLHLAAGRVDEGVEALVQLLEVAERNGNTLEVETTCETILQYKPEHINIREKLLRIHEKLGGPTNDTAEEAFALAHSLASTGEHQRALAYYQRVARLRPDDSSITEKMAESLTALGQSSAAADRYFDLGRQAFDAGDFDKAERFCRMTTDLVPTHQDGWKWLVQSVRHHHAPTSPVETLTAAAQCFYNAQQYKQAEEYLREALTRQANFVPAQVMLIDLLINTGQRVQAHQEQLLLAKQYQQLGKTDQALRLYEMLNTSNPADVATASAFAEMLWNTNNHQRYQEVIAACCQAAIHAKQPATVQPLLSEALANLPDADHFYRLRARCYHAEGNDEAVLETVEQMMAALEPLLERTAEPPPTALWLRVIRFLDEVLEWYPDAYIVYRWRAVASKNAGDVAGAVRNLLELSESLQQLWQRTPTHLERDEIAVEVCKTFEDLDEYGPTEPELMVRRAEILAGVGRAGQATDTVRVVLAKYLEQTKFAEALDAVRKCLQWDPYESEILKIGVRCCRKLSQKDELAELGEQLVQTLADQEDWAEALSVAKMLVEESGQLVPSLRLLAKTASLSGQPEQAIPAYLDQANRLAHTGQIEQAVQLCHDALRHLGPLPQIQEEVVELCLEAEQYAEVLPHIDACLLAYQQSHQPEKSLKLLAKVLSSNPNNTTLRKKYAELLEEQGQHSQALTQLGLLAQAYRQSGLSDKAIEVYRQLREQTPEDKQIRHELVELMKSEGMLRAAARETLALAQHLYQQGFRSRGKTRLHYLQEAETVAGECLELDNSCIEAFELLSGVQTELGNRESAVSTLQRLANAHLEAGRHEQGITALSHAVELDPDNQAVRTLAQQVKDRLNELQRRNLLLDRDTLLDNLIASEKYEDAITECQRLLQENPNNPDVLARLGQAQSGAGHQSDAIATYLDAAALYEQAHTTSQVLATLNKVLALDPQCVRALEKMAYLDEAAGVTNRAIETYLVLAKTHENANRYDDSLVAYRKVLHLNPNHRLAIADTAQLLWMKALQAQSSPGHWNNQALSHGNESLGLLLNLSRAHFEAGALNETIEELNALTDLVKVVRDGQMGVSATAPEYQTFQDLIVQVHTLLINTLQTSKRTEELETAYLNLANEHEETGRWQQALQLLEDGLKLITEPVGLLKGIIALTERHGEEAGFLPTSHLLEHRRLLVALLLGQGQHDEAISHLQALCQQAPTDIESHELLLKLLRESKQFDQAEAHLSKVVHCEIEAGMPGKALELLLDGMTWCSDRSGLLQQLVNIYVKQGYVRRACEALRRGAAEAVARGERSHAELLLSQALELESENVSLLLSYANHLLEEQRYEEALDPIQRLVDTYVRRGLPGRVLKIITEKSQQYPNWKDLVEIQAQIYDALGDRENAKEARVKARGMRSKDTAATSRGSRASVQPSRLGQLLRQQKKPRHVLSTDKPSSAEEEDYFSEGLMLFEQKHFQQARNKLVVESSKAKSDKNWDLFQRLTVALGKCYYDLRSYNQAKTPLRAALRPPANVDPELEKEALYYLALIVETEGKVGDKIKAWQEVCRVDPKYRDAKMRLNTIRNRK